MTNREAFIYFLLFLVAELLFNKNISRGTESSLFERVSIFSISIICSCCCVSN